MAINSNFSPQNIVPLNGPLTQAQAERIASNALQAAENGEEQQSARLNTSEANFATRSVFNSGMHLPVRSGTRHTSLRERRIRSGQHRPGVRKRLEDEEENEAEKVSAVDVSMVPGSLRDDSGEDRSDRVEEKLKGLQGRKLTRRFPPQIAGKAAAGANEAGPAHEGAFRARVALKKNIQEIRTQDPHELRRAMQDPDKLRQAITEIAGSPEKMAALGRRELRTYLGVPRPHMDASRVSVPLQPSEILKYAIAIGGVERCAEVMPVIRSLWAARF